MASVENNTEGGSGIYFGIIEGYMRLPGRCTGLGVTTETSFDAYLSRWSNLRRQNEPTTEKQDEMSQIRD